MNRSSALLLATGDACHSRAIKREWLLAALLAAAVPGLSLAVEAQTTTPGVATPKAGRPVFDDINRELARGQALLDNNDPRAESILRPIAEQALSALNLLAGADVLAKRTPELSVDGAIEAAVRQTAQAHYLWGVAADHAAQRDVAITALSRSLRLAGTLPNSNNSLTREALFTLSGIMREGLPLVAADDVLDTISSTVHGSLWKPQRFSFELPVSIKGPAVTPGELRSGMGDMRELLITSGRLFPPLDMSQSGANVSQVITPNGNLARIPPLYRAVAPDALPRVLKLDKMVIGYARESEGANRGLWRQVVRVYYPSTHLTRSERNDQPRAEALCLQFLKVHAMMSAGMGLGNPYEADGVTSIWLSEVSAVWPKDDDDPAIRTALGLVMPPLNTAVPGEDGPEVDASPLIRPWSAAGQVDSAPGEIMFFKMTEARDDSEWLREIIHEYSHVALPPFSGFRAPLEPYGNGEVGEALGMLWAASMAPESLQPQATVDKVATPATPPIAGDTPEVFSADIMAHVAHFALPALHLLNTRGPISALNRDDGQQGLDYLKGLAVYIDRVYGAPVLGAACKPLVASASAASDTLGRPSINTGSLLGSLPNALRDPFTPGEKAMPVWLAGALEAPSIKLTPAALGTRAPLRLRAGERAVAWLYMPPTASALIVAWNYGQPSLPGSLRVGGDWRTSPVAQAEGGNGAIRINIDGRSGWQRIAFIPTNDVVLQGAWFERANTKAQPPSPR